jgi:hypothetical protein
MSRDVELIQLSLFEAVSYYFNNVLYTANSIKIAILKRTP